MPYKYILTKPQKRALEIVKENGLTGGACFASQMWPEYEKATSRKKRGYNMRAGSFLARLRKLGLLAVEEHSYLAPGTGHAHYQLVYSLTRLGKVSLEEANALHAHVDDWMEIELPDIVCEMDQLDTEVQ